MGNPGIRNRVFFLPIGSSAKSHELLGDMIRKIVPEMSQGETSCLISNTTSNLLHDKP
jgi:hypothetical protein